MKMGITENHIRQGKMGAWWRTARPHQDQKLAGQTPNSIAQLSDF